MIIIPFAGKFAYIGVRYGKQIGRDIHIDFKDVAVNTTSERIVELVNHTPVRVAIILHSFFVFFFVSGVLGNSKKCPTI